MNFKIYGLKIDGDWQRIAVIRHGIFSMFQDIDDLVVTVVNSDVFDRVSSISPYLEVVDDKTPSVETLDKLRALGKELDIDIEVPSPLSCFISKS